MYTQRSALKKKSSSKSRHRKNVEIHESLSLIGFKEKGNDLKNMITVLQKKSGVINPVKIVNSTTLSGKTFRKRSGGSFWKKRVGVYTKKKSKSSKSPAKNSLDRTLSKTVKHKPIFHKGYADATKYGEEFGGSKMQP